MVQKMPYLLIGLINEVFDKNYPEDTEVVHHRNEHLEKNGKIITDSIVKIGDIMYHIECQSTPDTTMVIRMIEYDFAIALERAYSDGEPYEINMPNSCVLYLRHGSNTPDALEMKVNLPDGQSFIYKSKIVKAQIAL